MKIAVIYGGRGLIEDPALSVLEKIQMVLEELRVEVVRVNLYEQKSVINTIPATLKDVDAVVLGVSLEWFGIGGYRQQFLDACWMYGDKEKMQSLYMLPVVIATAAGERAAVLSLQEAWEILGGIPLEGIAAYVEDGVAFERNKQYGQLIEKCAEDLYRVVNQKRVMLPSSGGAIRKTVQKSQNIDLTPQESEQLSRIVSDDSFVRQQKADVQDLSSLFKDLLKEEDAKEEKKQQVQMNTDAGAEERILPQIENKIQAQVIPKDFKERFMKNFHPEAGFQAVFVVNITDKEQILKIAINEDKLTISTGIQEDGDVILRLSSGILHRITIGEITFQRAFMSGDMKVKGNFKTLRTLDRIFCFA